MHFDRVRETKRAILYFLVGLFYVGGLKGRPSKQHRKEDHPYRPTINLEAVTTLWRDRLIKYFWCQVIWCATNGLFAFAVKSELGCEPKVANFYVHALC